MGQHTIAVLEEAGYSREEIETLVRQHAVIAEKSASDPAQ
jgi:crotonobetainyl-CoA:carnitine CoA-transferase CaiB-like acyl-CoA transferase